MILTKFGGRVAYEVVHSQVRILQLLALDLTLKLKQKGIKNKIRLLLRLSGGMKLP